MKCLINHRAAPHSITQFKKYFDVVSIDPHSQYDPKEHFVFIDNRENTAAIDYWCQHGFKVVVEKFWEQTVDDADGSYTVDNCLHLYSPNWVWFDLALYNQSQMYNYVRSISNPKHFFLLLMHLQKPYRDKLFLATQKYHAESLCSYVARGLLIDGDVPVTQSKQGTQTTNQNFYNADWYANTTFSLVAESKVLAPRFVSEKIFKPLAFQHPFMVFGTVGTLAYLQQLGFETFEHVIDESYDHVIDTTLRLNAIQQQLEKLYLAFSTKEQLFVDSISKQKITHNYHRFYDIEQSWETEIINPIKEFISA